MIEFLSSREQTGKRDRLLLVVGAAYQSAVWAFIKKLSAKNISAFRVRLMEPFKPRTTGPDSQNHALNGYVQQFCADTGNDFDDIKMFVKKKAMRRGLRSKTNEKGEIIYSKIDGEPIPISEADMSTEECGWCIEEIVILAAEFNVRLIDGWPR